MVKIGRSLHKAHMGVSRRPEGVNHAFRIVSTALVDVIKTANVIKIAVWTNLYLLHFHYVKFSRLHHLLFMYTIN